MPDYREVEEDFKGTKEEFIDKKAEEETQKESTKADVMVEDDKDDFEDICFMCRRPESIAGKMIHIPMENVCLCTDCMERSFTMMNNTPIDYDEVMKNMNFNMFGGNMMGDGIPKSQRLKKKKAKKLKRQNMT